MQNYSLSFIILLICLTICCSFLHSRLQLPINNNHQYLTNPPILQTLKGWSSLKRYSHGFRLPPLIKEIRKLQKTKSDFKKSEPLTLPDGALVKTRKIYNATIDNIALDGVYVDILANRPIFIPKNSFPEKLYLNLAKPSKHFDQQIVQVMINDVGESPKGVFVSKISHKMLQSNNNITTNHTTSELSMDRLYYGRIISHHNFGAFVKIENKIEGLLPFKNIVANGMYYNFQKNYPVGSNILVNITYYNATQNKLTLAMYRTPSRLNTNYTLECEPFQWLKGYVAQILQYGLLIRPEGFDYPGLLHIKNIPIELLSILKTRSLKQGINVAKWSDLFTIGDVLKFRINGVEKETNRMFFTMMPFKKNDDSESEKPSRQTKDIYDLHDLLVHQSKKESTSINEASLVLPLTGLEEDPKFENSVDRSIDININKIPIKEEIQDEIIQQEINDSIVEISNDSERSLDETSQDSSDPIMNLVDEMEEQKEAEKESEEEGEYSFDDDDDDAGNLKISFTPLDLSNIPNDGFNDTLTVDEFNEKFALEDKKILSEFENEKLLESMKKWLDVEMNYNPESLVSFWRGKSFDRTEPKAKPSMRDDPLLAPLFYNEDFVRGRQRRLSTIDMNLDAEDFSSELNRDVYESEDGKPKEVRFINHIFPNAEISKTMKRDIGRLRGIENSGLEQDATGGLSAPKILHTIGNFIERDSLPQEYFNLTYFENLNAAKDEYQKKIDQITTESEEAELESELDKILSTFNLSYEEKKFKKMKRKLESGLITQHEYDQFISKIKNPELLESSISSSAEKNSGKK